MCCRASRWPKDATPKREKKAVGAASLETPLWSSLGHQPMSRHRSQSGAMFSTASRRVTHSTLAPGDTNPERCIPSNIRRAPTFSMGSESRFKPNLVLGVNVHASPGPAFYDRASAERKLAKTPATTPVWSKPSKPDLRYKNGRPKSSNIYRF